jgi:hypothetical protein
VKETAIASLYQVQQADARRPFEFDQNVDISFGFLFATHIGGKHPNNVNAISLSQIGFLAS